MASTGEPREARDSVADIPIPPLPHPVPLPPIPGPAPTITQLPSPTLGGAIGCDFRSGLNQLLFVEFSGNVSRMNLFPTATVLSSGTTILKGTFTFDLDTGVEGGVSSQADIWWEQMTSVARQMVPQNGAGIFNLGAVDFASLSSSGLQKLPFSTAPIPGNNDPTNKLVNGDVFAVRTQAGNFAKVLVVTYGYDLTIEWVTYQLDPMYQVLGTGYNQPEDVKASGDGVHAYVTERAGDLLRVNLSSANRASATVVASGMTAPQQLFLDENAGAAYTVEYSPSGTLWRIDLTSGTKTPVLTGLQNAVGVTLSLDRQFAYVTEQTTGPEGGRVSRFQLSNGQRVGLVTGLTAPFFLTWTDSTETALYCPLRDPANAIVTVSTGGGSVSAATGLAFRPSSVAVVSPGFLLVCCDQVIEEVLLSQSPLQPTGPLLQGIGFVPFDWITAGGLADTTAFDPTYFYPVTNAPFGGSLPVMVNFLRAGLDGASFYQVKVDGNLRTDLFNTAKWNGTEYVPTVFGPQMVGGNPGYYPVPAVSDLMLYIQPLPGCYLDSTNLASAQTHTITVDFFDAGANPVESATPLVIYVDNNPCSVSLAPAAIGTNSATTDCGFLAYNPATVSSDDVTIVYTASQPEGFANWSFSLIKAGTSIASASGPVTSPPAPFNETVAAMLGTCTVAAFAAYVYVAATANTGWSRCSQYDRSASQAFALAP
jgi:hypothetical protein